MFSRMRVLALLLAVAVTLVAATPALAAKAGGHGGRGGTASASLSIWQNGAQVTSVAVGSTVEVKCSGLQANTSVYVGLMNTVGMKSVVTDGAGNCSVSWTMTDAGWFNFFVANQSLAILATSGLTVS